MGIEPAKETLHLGFPADKGAILEWLGDVPEAVARHLPDDLGPTFCFSASSSSVRSSSCQRRSGKSARKRRDQASVPWALVMEGCREVNSSRAF
ncbi:MAG: hypothetical protein ABL994_03635, partial [Verrucomicrobiales bacterium]